jgi:hypothetical protein
VSYFVLSAVYARVDIPTPGTAVPASSKHININESQNLYTQTPFDGTYSSTSYNPFAFQRTRIYPVHIDVGGYAVHSGNARSAILGEIFLPLAQNKKHLFFTNLRAYKPDNRTFEGNLALGLRGFANDKTMLGAYAIYDRYRSQNRNYYNQATFGAELWRNHLFIGANTYVPFGTKKYFNDAINRAYLSTPDASNIQNILCEQGQEEALPGFDAQAGYEIWRGLTIYGGGYYFGKSGVSTIAGPKLRATYTWYTKSSHRLFGLFDRIRLETQITHDHPRGTSWYAGLRFSVNFGAQRRYPMTLMQQHMIDPIRRDMNFIVEDYNDPPEVLTDSTGNVINVIKIDTSDGSLSTAIANSDIDIIGIKESVTALAALNIDTSLRDLTITGGEYSFTNNGGHSFTLPIGEDGQLTAASGTDLFTLSGSSDPYDFTLENIQVSTDTEQFAFNNDSDGLNFGHLTFNNVTSNAAFNITLAENNGSGTVTFTNNSLTITDPPVAPTGAAATQRTAIAFTFGGTTDNPRATITIDDFSNNTLIIDSTNAVTGTDSLYGVYHYIDSINTAKIIYTNGFKNNRITINEENANADNHDSYGVYFDMAAGVGGANEDAIIQFSDDFSNNRINIQYADEGYAFYDDDARVTFLTDFKSNRLFANNNGSDGTAWSFNGASTRDLTIDGNFSNNILRANNNNGTATANLSYAWDKDGVGNVIIVGNVSDNDFRANNNQETSYAWHIEDSGNVTIGGDFKDNTFLAIGMQDSGADGYAWNTDAVGDFILEGDFSGNTLEANENADLGYGWDKDGTGNMFIKGNIDSNIFCADDNTNDGFSFNIEDAGDVIIDGNFSNNTILLRQNATITSDEADGWRDLASGTVLIKGNFNNNTMTLTGNRDATYGWHYEGSGDLTIVGNFSNNKIYMNENIDTSPNYAWSTDGSSGTFTLFGNFNNNIIQANNNVDTAYAIDIADSSGVHIHGNFNDNIITATGNNDDSRAFSIDVSAVDVTFSGSIENNTFTSDATDDSYAFYVEAQTGSIVNFNGEISGNTLSSSSSTSGITEEFYLENSASTINLPQVASATALSEDNNNAQVTTSGTINFGS